MHKRQIYFLTLVFTLYGFIGSAQDIDYDSAYVPVDSVGTVEDIFTESYDEETENDEDRVALFDKIAPVDKGPISVRQLDEKQVNNLQKDEDFWYANEAPLKEVPKEPKESALNKLAKEKWFRNLLWTLVVGGFVAVLIWFIISSDIQLFKRQATSIPRQEEEDELINQSIFDINYDAEIQKAIAAQNFRLAIRLFYLQTLKRLSEENIINYKQERTNSDYLMQLFNTSYYKDFFRLTRHFEYAWYGQFPVAPASFEVIKTDFVNFKKRFLS